MHDSPFFHSPEVASLRAVWLSRGVPFLFEQSAQFRPGRLASDRGLFSIPIAALGAQASEQTLWLCQQWGAPPTIWQSIARYFPRAVHVHFGLELGERFRIAKCYLELAPPQHGGERSAVRFLGYKWSDGPAATAVLSRYRDVAAATWATAESAVDAVLTKGSRPRMLTLLAAARAGSSPAATISLLEIRDEGSERLSYDVNCYAQSLTLQSVAAPIRSLAEGFDIPASACDAWLDRVSAHSLGHIAFGKDGQQCDFATLYHRSP